MEKKSRLKSIRSLPKKEDILKNPDESTDRKIDEPTFGEDPFDFEKLKGSWDKLKELRSKNGGLKTEILLLDLPYELEGTKINLHLISSLQQEQLKSYHTDIVTFLRKDLNNRHIELEATLSEIEREELLYTNREKFEHMMKINPKLRLLRDKLELDPDF